MFMCKCLLHTVRASSVCAVFTRGQRSGQRSPAGQQTQNISASERHSCSSSLLFLSASLSAFLKHSSVAASFHREVLLRSSDFKKLTLLYVLLPKLDWCWCPDSHLNQLEIQSANQNFFFFSHLSVLHFCYNISEGTIALYTSLLSFDS